MTNPSLQKKSAARMAAVQCLYQQSVAGSDALQQVAALREQLKDNRDEQKLLVGSAIEPNYTLVEKLVSGVAAEQTEIDIRLDGTLRGDWKRERLSPLMIAIMQCAIYEMFFGKEISAKIVIDEYTRLTRRFFADAEVNFVHAALSKLAEQYG